MPTWSGLFPAPLARIPDGIFEPDPGLPEMPLWFPAPSEPARPKSPHVAWSRVGAAMPQTVKAVLSCRLPSILYLNGETVCSCGGGTMEAELGICSGSGFSFTKAYYADALFWLVNDNHGVGIVLLAGSEYLKLTEGTEQ